MHTASTPRDPEGMLMWRRIGGRLTTSGQPTEPQLAALPRIGVSHVVNVGLHTHKKAPADAAANVETDPSTARKHFFLKQEAKTFAHLAYALGQRERLTIKSFLVLFFKKELLPFVSQPYPRWRSGMSQTQANLVLQR
jgi:hypothetical protein